MGYVPIGAYEPCTISLRIHRHESGLALGILYVPKYHILEFFVTNSVSGILAIFSGICTILLFFFCPETHYKRDTNLETMIVEEDAEKEAPVMHAEQVETRNQVTLQSSRRTFVQELSLFPAHRLSKDNLIKSKAILTSCIKRAMIGY
ncbi:MAG: hypothetical protein CL912_00650 [Deltaproteobacteria bacterium]|nr:hypothetical protein [Deltaproteobacteria bacterium]|tara:strand:- start:1991 stop:2434 length:444 start_codon:yes stop_codon:yes gene_type:complete